MTKNAITRLTFAAATAALLWLPLAAPAGSRERILFNDGWRFKQGDPEQSAGKLAYPKIRDWVNATGGAFSTNPPPARPAGNPGADVAYTRPDFNDATWRRVDLPHDWAIEGPFQQEYPGETGKLPYWGVGWYRKTFNVHVIDQGKRFLLEIDGAMSYANVWVNGQYAGGWPYGYASWALDITPYIKIGSSNVIAVRLDNPPDSSRWYPGAGLYRNVWLVKTAPVHIAHWGVQITTPEVSERIARVVMNVTVDNASATAKPALLSVRIFALDAAGRKTGEPVAEIAPAQLTFRPGAATTTLTAFLPNPKLWGVNQPNRYTAVITLANDVPLDVVETPFGIRRILFTADHGFLLNGVRVPIRGVCLHHDLGALGAAFNLRAMERQLELLRAFGCNAIRTAHNPPAPEVLDLCDRLGFLVMDEAFDVWRMPKRTNDYSVLFDDWHEKDLRAFVRRDRNHPAVILWSIGNEIYEQRDGSNAPLAARLAAIVREEDPTRPVNMALHVVAASTNGFQNAVDVFGYNYTPFGYAEFRARHPNLPLIGSETASVVSSRGEYFFPVSTNRRHGRVNFQATSYDYAAPSWAMPPDVEFKAQDQNPFVAGEFVWTGLDYLGEPTPYDSDTTNRLLFSSPAVQAEMDALLQEQGRINVPSRSSYFGILDLCGFPKDRFYLYQSRWRPDLPMVHILPHWNWPERLRQVTPVYVYTTGDEAELFLNGKSLGRKAKKKFEYRLRWDDVKYEPGRLEAVAYNFGVKWASATVKTTGGATRILLEPDRPQFLADGRDLCFITATIADPEGLRVPRANNRVRFTIDGPAEIVATDNGDATCHEPFRSAERNAFNGLCLAIVRGKAGMPGPIILRAQSAGLPPAGLELQTLLPASAR